jgi:hypothetical protein
MREVVWLIEGDVASAAKRLERCSTCRSDGRPRRRWYSCAGAEESTARMLRLRCGIASLLNATVVAMTGFLSL